jgi:hypothetical protein
MKAPKEEAVRGSDDCVSAAVRISCSRPQTSAVVVVAVTSSPTAEWLARQITEAFPWDTAPKYLIRDNDRAFGAVFKARVQAQINRRNPVASEN